MKTLSYSIRKGCLPCCDQKCGSVERPMKAGDEALLYLKQEVVSTLPERILAFVQAVTTSGEVTTYEFTYDEVQLAGSGVITLDQTLVKDFPVCYGVIEKLQDRITLLEAAVFP